MNNMMVKEHEMKNEIYKYIADSVNCTVEQLKSGTTCFVKNPWKGCIKILSIHDTDIISLSEDKYAIGKQMLTGKNRDELYESTLIFGQTLHYASVTNLASQAVAIRSGYMPLWTDSYGVR